MTALLETPKVVELPTLEDNLGLAYSAALKFVHPRRVDVEDTDEYADALEALWKACDSWTPERGRFSTHAHKCMRNAIINGRRDRGRRSVEAEPLQDVAENLKDAEWLMGIDPDKLIQSLFADDPGESQVAKRNKMALFQHYMENASWEELGKRFGVSKNRAFQYGQQAILLLKEKINGISNCPS